jgi:hypothetical protein
MEHLFVLSFYVTNFSIHFPTLYTQSEKPTTNIMHKSIVIITLYVDHFLHSHTPLCQVNQNFL